MIVCVVVLVVVAGAGLEGVECVKCLYYRGDDSVSDKSRFLPYLTYEEAESERSKSVTPVT